MQNYLGPNGDTHFNFRVTQDKFALLFESNFKSLHGGL